MRGGAQRESILVVCFCLLAAYLHKYYKEKENPTNYALSSYFYT
jgi:hypothetical protein